MNTPKDSIFAPAPPRSGSRSTGYHLARADFRQTSDPQLRAVLNALQHEHAAIAELDDSSRAVAKSSSGSAWKPAATSTATRAARHRVNAGPNPRGRWSADWSALTERVPRRNGHRGVAPRCRVADPAAGQRVGWPLPRLPGRRSVSGLSLADAEIPPASRLVPGVPSLAGCSAPRQVPARVGVYRQRRLSRAAPEHRAAAPLRPRPRRRRGVSGMPNDASHNPAPPRRRDHRHVPRVRPSGRGLTLAARPADRQYRGQRKGDRHRPSRTRRPG